MSPEVIAESANIEVVSTVPDAVVLPAELRMNSYLSVELLISFYYP